MWILMLQRRLAALVLVCAAVGCGGGGGGSPPPGSGPIVIHPPPTNVSVPDTSVAETHDTGTHTTDSITFSPASEAGATFEGNLDGAGFVAIPVPWNISGLADGDHTVAIRARNSAGNFDPTPFTFAWRVDANAPIATIAFPPPASATDAATITVRGSATDSSEISSLEVNGVAAESDDGFATWLATIPLSSSGSTTLTVSTKDSVGHSAASADSATILRTSPLISQMRGMDYDAARNRIVVSDGRTNTIYAFDADTGVGSVLSANHAPGSTPSQSRLEGLVIDASDDRALVVDSGANALIAVDLETGDRSLVTNTDSHPIEAAFIGAIGIALDATNNRAFVGNGSYASIIEVDLDTGNRTVIARSMPGDIEPFFNPVSLAYDDQTDPASPRLLVVDMGSKIVQVDLASRTWSPFVLAAPSLGEPIDIKLDPARDRLLILDDRNNQLLAADLTTATVTTVGSNGDGFGESLDPTFGLAVRASPSPRIFTGQALGEVIGVDASTQVRTTLVSSRVGTGDRMPLISSLAVEQSSAATSLIANAFGFSRMVRIDLGSGTRTTIAENFLQGGAPAGGIADITIDRNSPPEAPSALALVSGVQSLVSVNTTNGQITHIADLDSPDPPTTHPWSMALDGASSRVVFINQDTTPGGIDSLYEIDLSARTRRTIASDATGTGPALIEAVDLVLEPATAPTRALVSDNGHRALLWVDLSTGDRMALTPLSQQGFHPGRLFLDSAKGRVLGYDGANSGSLFAVDLATGSRTVISGHDIGEGPKGTGPLIGNAQGLDVDTSSGIAFMSDFASGAVLAVDLLTGQRVIVAH